MQGLKFRRQQPIGPFIADFYCASHRLVIEIDGNIHNNQEIDDELRTQQFEKYAYHVIRFNNRDVVENMSDVLAEIIKQCQIIEHEKKQEESPFSQKWEMKEDASPFPQNWEKGRG